MYCTKCGFHLSDDDVYCKKCGFKVIRDNQATVSEFEKNIKIANVITTKNLKKGKLKYGVILIILSMIFGYVYISSNDNSPEKLIVGKWKEKENRNTKVIEFTKGGKYLEDGEFDGNYLLEYIEGEKEMNLSIYQDKVSEGDLLKIKFINKDTVEYRCEEEFGDRMFTLIRVK